MEFIPQQIWAFGLVFARLGGIFMLAPALSDTSVPPRIRLSLALLVSFIIAPLVSYKLPPLPATNGALYALLGVEIVIGLAIGSILRVLFSALTTAGAIAGMQSGLGFAMSIDPSQGQQGSIFSTFLVVVGTALIFASNLHHLFITGMINSYNFMPPNGHFNFGANAEWAIKSFSDAFGIAVRITAPMLLFGIVYNVVLGVINRAAPAIQVFFIAQPIQVFLGIFLFLITLGAGMMTWVNFMADAARQLN
ncbi:flagellar biosynthetic protein FliR [Pseudaquidulcibacter saccharophilus]|uniref:flagellar biosynthetic protein FliR n=1 Tax=Pseudaquidulcibacter saccharophilus TaxID=2831900 RepID=UPI001EFF0C51|nr:flagellar biosynthetic protein FliR [Pseudaquidulcibacter saccharophilus]